MNLTAPFHVAVELPQFQVRAIAADRCLKHGSLVTVLDADPGRKVDKTDLSHQDRIGVQGLLIASANPLDQKRPVVGSPDVHEPRAPDQLQLAALRTRQDRRENQVTAKALPLADKFIGQPLHGCRNSRRGGLSLLMEIVGHALVDTDLQRPFQRVAL